MWPMESSRQIRYQVRLSGYDRGSAPARDRRLAASISDLGGTSTKSERTDGQEQQLRQTLVVKSRDLPHLQASCHQVTECQIFAAVFRLRPELAAKAMLAFSCFHGGCGSASTSSSSTSTIDKALHVP